MTASTSLATQAATVASTPAPHIPLQGIWVHFGVQHQEHNLPPAKWSMHAGSEFDHFCGQLHAWGVTGIHPKVGEGALPLWYSDQELVAMRQIAHSHGLQIAPYMYLYGETFGPGAMVTEVQHTIKIGKIFGAVVLDMESQWEGHNGAAWMQKFGFLLRKTYGYTGIVIPTTFGDPGVKSSFPYLQMNEWCDAWMPQAYFDEWTIKGHMMTAYDAIGWLDKQWKALDAACMHFQKQHLKPILPIIDLAKAPHVTEVVHWLEEMHGFGYCGFWYDQPYYAYANAIARAPKPGVHPVVLPPPHIPPKPVVLPPPAPKPPVTEPVKSTPPSPASTHLVDHSPVTPPSVPVAPPVPVVAQPGQQHIADQPTTYVQSITAEMIAAQAQAQAAQEQESVAEETVDVHDGDDWLTAPAPVVTPSPTLTQVPGTTTTSLTTSVPSEVPGVPAETQVLDPPAPPVPVVNPVTPLPSTGTTDEIEKQGQQTTDPIEQVKDTGPTPVVEPVLVPVAVDEVVTFYQDEVVMASFAGGKYEVHLHRRPVVIHA